jgi:hypothetical protein
LGAGCAAFTSSGPVGPLRSGNTTQVAAAWAYAYGPATVVVGGVTIKGNADMQASSIGTPSLPSPLPATVGVRQAFGDDVELGADIGIMDSGLRLRVGTPDGSSLPWDLAFEARTGKIAAFPTGTGQAGLAFEAYPDITPAQTFPQRRLILSLGITGGIFQHQLPLPFSFDPDDDIGDGTMILLRPELRLESAVGIYLANGKSAGLSIVVAPWILIGSEAPTSAICPFCGPAATPTTLSVTSYSKTLGPLADHYPIVRVASWPLNVSVADLSVAITAGLASDRGSRWLRWPSRPERAWWFRTATVSCWVSSPSASWPVALRARRR